MGQKVNPVGMRIGINKDWSSKWFAEKKDFSKLLKNDIRNFHKGFVFNFSDPEGLLDKTDKVKLQHTYFMEDDIWVDDKGNERGDSIDLSPTTYVLDDIVTYDWDDLMTEEISVQIYEED